jgi:hypothetical protein
MAGTIELTGILRTGRWSIAFFDFPIFLSTIFLSKKTMPSFSFEAFEDTRQDSLNPLPS